MKEKYEAANKNQTAPHVKTNRTRSVTDAKTLHTKFGISPSHRETDHEKDEVTMLDPIEEKRNQRYSREELEEFFKGSGAVAQRLRHENPTKYAEIRKSAEAMGIIGPSLIGTPAPNVPYKRPTRTYTSEELEARGRYSEDYCRQLFASGNGRAARELYETDREGYEDLKDAAISFSILPPRSTPRPTPAPVAAPEFTLRISDELAKESNLPVGTIVNETQLAQLCEQKVARARQAKEAADRKAAADRQAELEKLTAAQRLEQAARDKKQADVDRLVELTTPKQTPAPEPLPLATARVIAQEKAKSVEVPVKA